LAAGGDASRRPASSRGRGTLLHRYVLLRQLGAGGMGEVYVAFDPDLDRQIAIKLLRTDRFGSDDAAGRLLREAQAMAKLSHPHTITVYDVGTHGDEVFVAMELLDGSDLGAWLAERPRTWREIVSVFVDAGHGLDAAHQAGLVHRDFKPGNVMITRAGRVKVLDFGLARPAGSRPDAPSILSEMELSPPRWLDTPMTRVGSVLGTLGYMSPEQIDGATADARSDQFSFCVALWEALYGRLPFAGKNPLEVQRAIQQGEIREPPARSKVPARLRRILERGLAVDPDLRYPLMAALLADLEHDPVRARLRWAAAGAVVAAIVAVAALAWQAARGREQLCAGGPARLAGVWDTAAKADVEASFHSTGASYAESAWWRVEALLDRYAADWVSAHREACEATHRRGEQSPQLLDLRMACLDDRLAELGSLTELYRGVDGDLLEEAVDATESLSPLADCADLPRLRNRTPLPTGSARRALDELRPALGEIRALRHAAEYEKARNQALELVDSAQRVDYSPFRAEALFELGLAERELGRPDEASRRLRQALHQAEAGGAETTTIEISIDLAGVDGVERSRLEWGQEWLEHARALLSRVGDDPALRASLWEQEAFLAKFEGHPEEALELATRALESERERLGSDHPRVIDLLDSRAVMLGGNARYEEALELHRRILALREESLGPHHPVIAIVLGDIARAHNSLGQYEPAEQAFLRAREILEAALGPDHPRVGWAHGDLGTVYEMWGKPEASLRHNRRAFEIHQMHGQPWDVAAAHNNLAVSYVRLGRHAEALEHHRQALAGLEAVLGPDHVVLAHPLWGLGMDLLGLGRPDEAVPHLERGLALREAHEADAAELAEMRFALAQALWAQGRERVRAVRLAELARDDFGGREAERHEVEQWLATRQ
jgi:tetratricopeptide (TPR) repeat protein